MMRAEPMAAALQWRSEKWRADLIVVLAAIVLVAGVSAGSALAPLQALLALALVLVVASIWKWPALGAYLLIGLTPLTAGFSRGTALPLIRVNEAIALLVGFALISGALFRLRTGELPKLRMDAVEVSMVLLAVFSSIVPILWMTLRQQTVTSDDLLYGLVLWKFFGLYVLIRMSVRSDREVARCLWISVAAASIVAGLAILQSLHLFGVPRLLATWFPPFGFNGSTDTFSARGSSTLALPAATADLMLYNLAIVAGLWTRARRFRALLAPVAALLVLAALSAGEFSSAIGVVVAVIAIAVVTNSVRLLALFPPAGFVASQVLQPVFAERLSGFQSVTGLPGSWTTRLQNLESYFWPKLFSGLNFVLGVRPAARVPVASQVTGWVWIESGYTWLLWAGGLPLVGSFIFFAVAVARRGWKAAHQGFDAGSVAGMASFVGIVMVAVLMTFDPHLTYRGAGDALFGLIALAAPRRSPASARPIPSRINAIAEEVRG